MEKHQGKVRFFANGNVQLYYRHNTINKSTDRYKYFKALSACLNYMRTHNITAPMPNKL